MPSHQLAWYWSIPFIGDLHFASLKRHPPHKNHVTRWENRNRKGSTKCRSRSLKQLILKSSKSIQFPTILENQNLQYKCFCAKLTQLKSKVMYMICYRYSNERRHSDPLRAKPCGGGNNSNFLSRVFYLQSRRFSLPNFSHARDFELEDFRTRSAQKGTEGTVLDFSFFEENWCFWKNCDWNCSK